MCEPISTTAAVIGGVQAVAGGAKAIAGHQQQTRSTYLANKSRLDQYNAQLAQREVDWNQRNAVYNQQLSQYDASGMRARDALARGYGQGQAQLNDVYKAGAASTLQQGIETSKAIGRAQARGQTGRSAALSAQNALSAYGRNQAMIAENIMGARNRYAYDLEGLRQRYESNRAGAYGKVAVNPMLGAAPTKPVYAEGPSKLGLLANLGSAAASGFGTAMSLSAANPISNTPTPPTEGLNLDAVQSYMP